MGKKNPTILGGLELRSENWPFARCLELAGSLPPQQPLPPLPGVGWVRNLPGSVPGEGRGLAIKGPRLFRKEPRETGTAGAPRGSDRGEGAGGAAGAGAGGGTREKAGGRLGADTWGPTGASLRPGDSFLTSCVPGGKTAPTAGAELRPLPACGVALIPSVCPRGPEVPWPRSAGKPLLVTGRLCPPEGSRGVGGAPIATPGCPVRGGPAHRESCHSLEPPQGECFISGREPLSPSVPRVKTSLACEGSEFPEQSQEETHGV